MFITKQYNYELDEFITNKSRYTMELAFANLQSVYEIICWCRENFQGDGAAKIMNSKGSPDQNDNIIISWYMIDETDFMAFKLRWS